MTDENTATPTTEKSATGSAGWTEATKDMAIYGAVDLAPALEPRYVSETPRSKIIALEWPVEFDGKVYHQIRVHRVTGKEMRDFMEELRSGDGAVMPPMIDCPLAVWEGMDADDQHTLDEAAGEFMPKRLKMLQQAAAALDTAGN
ncbi:MAG: hypothetical protein KL863_14395 [Rhizobium sp.]|nr:hypothetical protein [Rhizobium sp.]